MQKGPPCTVTLAHAMLRMPIVLCTARRHDPGGVTDPQPRHAVTRAGRLRGLGHWQQSQSSDRSGRLHLPALGRLADDPRRAAGPHWATLTAAAQRWQTRGRLPHSGRPSQQARRLGHGGPPRASRRPPARTASRRGDQDGHHASCWIRTSRLLPQGNHHPGRDPHLSINSARVCSAAVFDLKALIGFY